MAADNANIEVLDGQDVEKLWSTVVQYQGELDVDGDVRDSIRVVTREVDKTTKKITFGIMAMHSNPSDENLKKIGENAREQLKTEIGPLLAKLNDKIPVGDYYKFNDMWRMAMQRVCSVATITHYLIHGNLPTMQELGQLISLPSVSNKEDRTLFLDYEEYLFGLLDLANELSRLCRNVITFGGKVEKAHEIHQVLNDLNAAMHNITFKNDYLRKKYDGLKYQIKIVEEVIYDLKMRSMVNAQPTPADSASAGT